MEKVVEKERRNTTVLHGNYTEIYTETTQKLKPAENIILHYTEWVKKSRTLVRRRKRNRRKLLRSR